MRIALVAPSPVPFVIGGAEKLFWGMVRNFNERTPHFVELLKIPVRDQDFWSLMDGYRRFAELDLSSYDLVLSTKYPAWAVAHANHHVYMQHPCRGVYDLYRGETHWEPRHRALEPLARLLQERPRRALFPRFFRELAALRDNPEIRREVFAFPGPLTRRIIHWLDQAALQPEEIVSYSAISRNVATRAHYFPPGVPVRVLHHPSDLENFQTGPYQTIFTASRLTELKRLHLLISAFRRLKADIPLRIAGTGSDLPRLQALAAGDERIHFLHHISDTQLLHEYAQALFVPYIPYDEDYGLVTVEAMHSAKAVLTTRDAGGVNELVVDAQTGLSVEPTEEALAEAMARLLADRAATEAMGRRARHAVAHINWLDFTARLMEQVGAPEKRPTGPHKHLVKGTHADTPGRPQVLVVNTFSPTPAVSGGRVRLLETARALSARAHVTILCLVAPGEDATVLHHNPHLEEEWVPRSVDHARRDDAYTTLLGVSADDVSAVTAWRRTPRFVERLRERAAAADVVMLSHPYLVDAVRSCYDGPLWLDAHNVEADLKAAIFGATPGAEAALQRVRDVERRAVTESERVFVCSDADAARLSALYGVPADRMILVPNGIAMENVRRLEGQGRRDLRARLGLAQNPVVLFMGSLHAPNRQAALWLADMAARHADLCFWIVGTVGLDEALQDLQADNVSVLGVLAPEEKAVVLNAAHCAVNPVTLGSGTNVKMLEYAAYEVPTVTTPKGNRGLLFEPGRHVVVCDLEAMEEALAATARRALAGDDAVEAMARNAAQLTAVHYDWPRLCRPMLEALPSPPL